MDFDYVSAHRLYRLPQKWWFWPAGAATAAAPDLVAAADRILDGVPLREVGERCPTDWRIDLDLDSSVTYSEGAADRVGVTLNRRGRSLVRLFSVVSQPTAVRCRLTLSVPRVRIDRTRVVFGVRNAPDTVIDVKTIAEAWRVTVGSVIDEASITLEAAEAVRWKRSARSSRTGRSIGPK